MLRRTIQLIRRERAIRQALVRLSSEYGGERIKGTGWFGIALAEHGKSAGDIEPAAQQCFDAVAHVCREDFGTKRKLSKPIIVVSMPSSIPVDAVVSVIDQRSRQIDPQVGGRYVPEFRTAVATGLPPDPWFYDCLAHELAHGFSELALGLRTTRPWALEGCANHIADLAIRRVETHALHGASFRHFREARGTGRHISLLRLLSIIQYSEVPEDYKAFFLHHATLFFRFLRIHATDSDKIRSALEDLLNVPTGPVAHDVQKLEEAFGQPLDSIEFDFFVYCDREEHRLLGPTSTVGIRPNPPA